MPVTIIFLKIIGAKSSPSSGEFSSLVLVLVLVLVSLCGLKASVRSQSPSSDSCSNIPTVSGIRIDNPAIKCISTWDSHNFILRYQQISANEWEFLLSAPFTDSYIAVGVSKNGQMVGSSALVGWASSDVFVTKQYELDGKTPAQVNPDQGSRTLNLSMIRKHPNRAYMGFKLIMAQPEAKLIYAVGPPGFMPRSDYRLVQHQDMTAISVNLASGQVSGRYTVLRRSHGILNILGWSILMIAGIIVARHCKQFDPMWFYVHAAVQSSACVLGLLGIICGFVLDSKISSSSVSTHKGLGIFILVLGCLQVMAIWVRPRKGLKVREYWNWYHQNVGRVLIIFAFANVFYGFHLGEEGKKWNLAYGISIGVLSVILIVLEIPKFRK